MSPRALRLDAGVPVALLPVRLETRFVDNPRALRIRIYPDPLHVHTHEPELTPDEVAAGRSYWTERFAVPGDAVEATRIWTQLAREAGPRRALWVVQAMTPRNVDRIGDGVAPAFPSPAEKDRAWSRAAYAALLPDRWMAIGIRGGREVFRKEGEEIPERLATGPDPDALDADAGDTVALDDALRWTVDYDDAVARGMAITVTQQEAGGGLARGLDQLIVLGVRDAPPADGAADLADLLRAHFCTDGLEALRPGAPTNNTEAARTGEPDPVEALIRALDPGLAVSEEPPAVRRLERALGIDGRAGIDRMPRADLDEQRTASLMFDVLWPATFGHYLDVLLDPLVSDATIAQLRAFARSFLQPGGPLPALRVGRQPYGLLPIVASARHAGDGIERGVHTMLERLRPIWRSAAANTPRLGVTGDPDTELLQLLQMTPLSALARFRRMIGPELEPNTQGLSRHALAQQYYATLLTRNALGFAATPRIAAFTVDPREYALRVPWVQADASSEDAPVDPDYLWQIGQTARADDGRATLNARKSTTLLDALVTQAALTELDDAAARVVHQHQLKIGALSRATARIALRAPEVVRLEGPTAPPATPGVPGPVSVDTPRDLGQLVLPALTGTDTVAVWVAKQLREAGDDPPPVLRDLASFLASLEGLMARPVAQVDRALRGALDCFSHRLDAWYTALATARLESLRARRAGVHVGGYGFVEDLRPDTAPDSLGYVHAPSLVQAAAAALLRSGHLAHRDAEHQTMNIDLRSDRVRLALGLLEGVAQGQPLAALLGYRLERALRDRDPRLARFILPLRRLAPLRPAANGDATVPTEAIAARDVVDGVALLERWRLDGRAVLNALSVPSGERQAVANEISALDDALDAVSDVLVAESVFQMTAGNPERARAALAVLDRQERPVEPEFVRTRRTGSNYAQRLLVLLGDDRPPPLWAVLGDARSAAEPRLNAWCAHLLGDPARYRFAGRIVTDRGARAADVQLRQLRLSPLSLVMAARRGGPDTPSELEERIAQVIAGTVTAADANPRIEIDSAPAGTAKNVGLGAFLVLLEWIGQVMAQRAVTAVDLAVPFGAGDEGIDTVDLAARADAAVATFEAARAALVAALAARRPNERTLRTALDRASQAGAKNAVPRALLRADGGTADATAVVASLVELGEAVRGQMVATRAALDALDASFAESPPTDARSRADHHIARIRTLFGEDFPVLPKVTVTNAVELSASASDRAALCDGDELAPLEWLQQLALVRPDTDALQRIVTATELLGGTVDPSQMQVVQLPHVPGQRWLALPQPDGASPTAETAIAFHAPSPIDFRKPVAGLVCDDWVETIPSAEAVTGLSFHYDAPGARAPNTVLLAVPADVTADTWSIDELVDVVREAAELAKLRMVGPRQLTALGTLLPTTCLPDNFRRDVPSVDIRNLTAASLAAPAILGKTR